MTEVKRPCETCEHYKFEPQGGFYSCSSWNCTQDAIKAPNRGENISDDKIFIHEETESK